ncbi:sugar efflux transporter for intercellular exchange-domain-containing protein [Catenaria anguillulae PL171]|uniref:Sugar transporter SWEET1 n=1 Tax=Catenaria anguillulae PL171 TaxID=765915 RepID=A0A1Y2HNR1_9FUNG|nr:sugar efflux transporter for intercellular exchange-domain-containing protein [Catenaria anguillulae PL171]
MDATALSWIATIVTVAYFLAPVFAIRRIHSTGTVGNTGFFPFVSMFVNCALWCKYGLLVPDRAIALVNGTGLVLSIIYMGVYYINHQDRDALDKHLLLASLVVYPTLIYSQFVTLDTATRHVGLIACVCSIVMFGSPLSALRRVLAARNASAMSLPVVSMSFVTTALWTWYGALIDDTNVIVPNGIGLVLAVVNLVVIGWFGRGEGGEYRRVM